MSGNREYQERDLNRVFSNKWNQEPFNENNDKSKKINMRNKNPGKWQVERD